MKPTILAPAVIGIIILVMVVVAMYIPNSLPVNSDFNAIYFTDLALVHGIHIYDIPKMEALALQSSGAPRETFFMPRFPYPPWYALSTFYLGLLPIHTAVTLWFELNLIMLFLSIWLLTDGWPSRLRLIAFPLGLFFLPVLGVLSVGQYDFPVLLGISLLFYALRKQNISLTVLGTILLTFKPHVGALILLFVLIYLIRSRGNFGRSAVRLLTIVGALLFILGFIADSKWPLSYPMMLLNYQGEGNVFSCSECVSVPVYLSRWLFDGSLSQAMMIALVVLVALLAIVWARRTVLLKSHELLLAAAVLITLLVSPYLYNYDFVLLLVPFSILLIRCGISQKAVVIICYLAPTIALATYGRAGNMSLIIVTLILALLLFLHATFIVDVSTVASYNTKN